MKKILLSCAILLTLLCACDNSDKTYQTELKEKNEELDKKLSDLETEVYLLKMNQDKFNTASFDPADGKGYQRIDATSGTFLVTLQEVVPHLDGVKVILNIGNIQYASYNGFKLKIDYGRRYPKYDAKDSNEESTNKRDLYRKSKREKEESFTKVLRPANWNTVTVFLPDIKPTDFGYMRLSLTVNSVLMSSN